MIAMKPNLPHLIAKDAELNVQRIVKRFRRRMTPPHHKFKRTVLINFYVRYPQFREESEEEKQAASRVKIDADLVSVIQKGYDQELLEKLRRFFAFMKRIFKKVVSD